VQLTNGYHSSNPDISPDGKSIAFVYQPDPRGQFSFAIMSSQGGPVSKIFRLPDTWSLWSLSWAPDGRALTFIDSRKGVDNLWNQPVAGGAAKQLTSFKADGIFNFAWSRDGRLVLARGALASDVVMISNFQAE
jgi:dipeptidyl aminopeptidase/acylaminoacyl peptidase